MPLFTSNDKKIFFLHIPKNAGSTVESFLSKHSSMTFFGETLINQKVPAQHLTYNDLQLVCENFIGLKKFCIVRHPCSRLISEFFYRKVKRGRSASNWNILKFLITYNLKRLRNNSVYSNHIRPQSDFISNDVEVFKLEQNGLIMALDYCSKYLDINCDFQLIESKNITNSKSFKPNWLLRIATFIIYNKDYKNFNYSL